MNRLKRVCALLAAPLVLILILALTPLTNVLFQSDVNGGGNNITNVNQIVATAAVVQSLILSGGGQISGFINLTNIYNSLTGSGLAPNMALGPGSKATNYESSSFAFSPPVNVNMLQISSLEIIVVNLGGSPIIATAPAPWSTNWVGGTASITNVGSFTFTVVPGVKTNCTYRSLDSTGVAGSTSLGFNPLEFTNQGGIISITTNGFSMTNITLWNAVLQSALANSLTVVTASESNLLAGYGNFTNTVTAASFIGSGAYLSGISGNSNNVMGAWNPVWMGADTNGIVDSTQAFILTEYLAESQYGNATRTISNCSALMIPPGTFLITSSLVFSNKNGPHWIGSSVNSSVLHWAGPTNANVFEVINCFSPYFANFTVSCVGPGPYLQGAQSAFDFQADTIPTNLFGQNGIFINIYVTGTVSNGFQIGMSNNPSNGNGLNNMEFISCNVSNTLNDGWYFHAISGYTTILHNCQAYHKGYDTNNFGNYGVENQAGAVKLDGGSYLGFSNVMFLGANSDGSCVMDFAENEYCLGLLNTASGGPGCNIKIENVGWSFINATNVKTIRFGLHGTLIVENSRFGYGSAYTNNSPAFDIGFQAGVDCKSVWIGNEFVNWPQTGGTSMNKMFTQQLPTFALANRGIDTNAGWNVESATALDDEWNSTIRRNTGTEFLVGGLNISNMNAGSVTLTTTGTPGATTYQYAATACTASGESTAGGTVSITTGNAVLSSGNAVKVSVTPLQWPTGANSINIYRISAPAGYLGSITNSQSVTSPTWQVLDIGQATGTSPQGNATPPTTNGTGGLTVQGTISGNLGRATNLQAQYVTFPTVAGNLSNWWFSSISGNVNATGGSNNATGYSALGLVTTGIDNVADGNWAGGADTVGSFLTLIGVRAGRHNTTGSNNTAVGYNDLAAMTSGQNNTAGGSGAMVQNITGLQNTAWGANADANGLGNNNGAFGFGALFTGGGDNNMAAGSYSQYYNSTGSNNVTVGPYSGASIISGLFNIYIGPYAGSNGSASGNLTGSNNVVIAYNGGNQYSGSESFNILIGGTGTAGDSYVTRIGSAGANGQTNAYIAGTVTAGNGAATFATNWLNSVAATAFTGQFATINSGWTNTGWGFRWHANVTGSAGNLVYYDRSGPNGGSIANHPVFTNQLSTNGISIPIGDNCGFQIVSGTAVVANLYQEE